MFRKIIYLSSILFLITACADTWGSVKRGLTGQKQNSTDEFLVEKKDPLVLPPNFEDLPVPSDSAIEEEENESSSFEKTLSTTTDEESYEGSSSNTTEESILNKIRKR
jgi:hypothetical protein